MVAVAVLTIGYCAICADWIIGKILAWRAFETSV